MVGNLGMYVLVLKDKYSTDHRVSTSAKVGIVYRDELGVGGGKDDYASDMSGEL